MLEDTKKSLREHLQRILDGISMLFGSHDDLVDQGSKFNMCYAVDSLYLDLLEILLALSV